MKFLFPLLLIPLLLMGCASQDPQPETTEPMTAEILIPAIQSEIQANAALEPQTLGAMAVYPLNREDAAGFLLLDENILLFSDSGTDTTITRFSGNPLTPDAWYVCGFPLTVEDPTLRRCGDGISFYDSHSGHTLILDQELQELQRIPGPEDMAGSPLLSSDGTTLYYCTPSTLRAMDTATGISRVIKEASYSAQSLSGLLMEDSVLQLTIHETANQLRTLFLATDTGRLLGESTGSPLVNTSGKSFFTYQNGSTTLSAAVAEAPRMLLPRMADSARFLFPLSGRAVTAAQTGAGETSFDVYDLISGSRTAGVTHPEALSPTGLCEDNHGTFWFLARSQALGTQALYRWNPAHSPVNDAGVYSAGYYTAESPDYEGLAACGTYAQEISAKYNLEVLVYKDATALQPWDYILDHEYQASVLMRELELLDARLQNFPQGFLQTLRDSFTALKICIVRQASGSSDSGSLEAVDGIQFFDGTDAYLVLCAGKDTESALYHEICHLMESVVMTRSTAYDRWDTLNPTNFSYDMDYIVNQNRDGSLWLQPGREYFIDTYSMSFPKEDRARILEYAMMSGYGEKFASPHMQAKLRQLSIGIREAFRLEDTDEPLLWEQYLQE